MKLKRNSTIPLVAGAALLLVLGGCGTGGESGEASESSSSAPEANTASEATEEVPAEDIQLSFIPGVIGDEFYITMQCSIEATAAELGVSVDTQGPAKFDPTMQKPVIDSVLAANPDALIIATTDTVALRPPLEIAAGDGTRIILVDQTMEDPSFVSSTIASDNVGGGAMAFEAMKELNPDGGKVLVMSTDPGVATLDQRTAGFEEAILADPSFEYLGVQYSHNDPAEASRLMVAALAKDPDIVGVFAGNLFSAEGTATGVRQSGLEDQVSIVAFDASPALTEALRNGTIQALIAQDPGDIGVQAVHQAVAAIRGEPNEADIQTGFYILTAENVDGEGAAYVYQSDC